MSRVGKTPIPVPAEVNVAIDGNTVTVTGAKGTLSRKLPGAITVQAVDGKLHVQRPDDTKSSKSLHGLSRTLIANMITGVSAGFSKELRIQGVGYRVNQSTPTSLDLALGYSHPVTVKAPEGIEFEVSPQRTQIVVRGIDKQLVGQVAADIRQWRKPEPYKGKGIRYANERVKRKAGKAAK